MAIDINGLLNKTENGGTTAAGILSAKEWNTLVQAVGENQNAVNGAIKGITFNGTDYKQVSNGMLIMNVVESGRSVKFNWIQNPSKNNVISKGSSCIVEFNVIDQLPSDDDASVLVPYHNPGTVTFFVDDKQVGMINRVYSEGADGYTGPVLFDFSKATTLSTKPDGNRLKIEYNNNGEIKQEIFTVYVLDLSISVDIESVYNSDNVPNIGVTIRGGNGNLYAKVDNENLNSDGDGNILPVGSFTNSVPFYIKDQLTRFNSHGIHTIQIWGEVEYSNTIVRTETISYNYIFGNKNINTPIVMSSITDGSEFELYNNLDVNYTAYLNNAQGRLNVPIKIIDGSNNILLSTTQSVEFLNGIGTGSYSFTLFPPSDNVNLIGNDRQLIISIIDEHGNEYPYSVGIKIKESSITLQQASGYLAYFNAMGRSNSETSDVVNKWISTSSDGTQTTDVTFDSNIEFIDTGSGWIADENGNTAMHLRKGRYFTLNYKPFDKNPTYGNAGKGKGLTISIEFATRNCLNANAKVISCMDYTQNETGRGFYVTASSVQLLANDIDLSAKFKEDTRIKLDIVIEKEPTSYSYDTVVGTDPSASDYVQKGTSDECLAIIYIDGVYTGLTLIKPTTTFQQGSATVPAQNIRFGSEDCDLDIYSIRIYERALLVNEILQNYSYDTPVQSEKIAIAKRNDIFSSANNNMPVIDPGKLRAARPDLPFFYVELDPSTDQIMPQNKSDWKLLSLSAFQNPKIKPEDADKDIAKAPWESKTGVLRNQGTSSMTYPWPWRNWDWKTGDSDFGDKKTFLYYFPDLNSSKTSDKWHQYDYVGTGSKLPLKKLTFKKDYASSEMCNNAICSEIFTDMALGIYTAYNDAVSPAMKKQLQETSSTDFRLTFKALPCFMFQHLPDKNAQGSAGIGLDGMGMMNLIPNKNEVGYLGFSANKWEDADDGVLEREQSWELGDNLDDVFWVKKLNYFTRNSDGTFTNDVKDNYEARTPKDSCVDWGDSEADFGMTPKGMKEISEVQAKGVEDEQHDIVDFHNWLVDCNQYLATGEDLTGTVEDWNRDENNNVIYTKDTKEYRKAKFKNEAQDRLILNQWLLYYIWKEQFWMFDSGLKNLQVYTVGPSENNPQILKWGCMVRDADTALGIENTGKDYFPPHIEDIDYYTESNGKITFHYGGAKDIYDIQELKSKRGDTARAVLNGQFGSVWVNLRDCFSAEIGQMYRTLTANYLKTNFGAAPSINKFRSHQEHWCEALYNFGMRQYFGGSPFSYFNKSGLGDKKNARASWLDRGFYYRRGKYSNLTDNSAFRINSYSSPDYPDNNNNNKFLNVKAYIPMYIGCGGTTAEMINSKNVIRMVPDENENVVKDISIGEAGFNFPSAGDAVSYIYGTSMLTDIGDLARVCKILRVQTMNFPKLREFNLGHESERDGITYREYATSYIENENGDLIVDPSKPLGDPREFRNEILPNLDCSSMKQLTLLDVTNHTNLSELNIKACDQLQKLYARGTALKSIEFPATTSLNTVYLGDELTSLTMENLTGITTFKINSLNNCSKLVIKNCGPVLAKQSYELVTKAINRLEQAHESEPDVCTLHGIDWTDGTATEDMLRRLVNINASLKGKIKLGSMSNELKVAMKNNPLYGNIDDPNSDVLYIEYDQIYIRSVSLPNKTYIHEPGDTQLKFETNPTTANTYDYAEWSMIGGSQYATIDSSTGIITRNNVEADESAVPAEVTVKVHQMKDQHGVDRETLTSNKLMVYFYERKAKPGDIVYNDGSFTDEIESDKKPIGICFYVDPNNDKNRLMVGLSCINSDNASVTNWGIGQGAKNSYNDQYSGTPQINNTYFELYPGVFPFTYGEPEDTDDRSIKNMTGLKRVFGITNYNSHGGDLVDYANGGGINVFNDDFYRESSSFKTFEDGALSTLGFATSNKNIRIDDIKKPGVQQGNPIIKVESGKTYPAGYIDTMAILRHRNRIINALNVDYVPYNVDDGNGSTTKFITIDADFKYDKSYPFIIDENDSVSNLKAKFNEINNFVKFPNYENKSHHYLYPAASLCYAYEPNVGSAYVLNDKFKKGNWFLPTAGDAARIAYYIVQHYAKNKDTDMANAIKSSYDDAYVFSTAIENSIFVPSLMLPSVSSTDIIRGESKFITSTAYETGSLTYEKYAAIKIDGKISKSSYGNTTITGIVTSGNKNLNSSQSNGVTPNDLLYPICQF